MSWLIYLRRRDEPKTADKKPPSTTTSTYFDWMLATTPLATLPAMVPTGTPTVRSATESAISIAMSALSPVLRPIDDITDLVPGAEGAGAWGRGLLGNQLCSQGIAWLLQCCAAASRVLPTRSTAQLVGRCAAAGFSLDIDAGIQIYGGSGVQAVLRVYVAGDGYNVIFCSHNDQCPDNYACDFFRRAGGAAVWFVQLLCFRGSATSRLTQSASVLALSAAAAASHPAARSASTRTPSAATLAFLRST